MTGSPLLDGALLGVSLFNTLLLLWLGLTVLLNVERRTRGSWMMGAGLLLGAAFFVSHTAILGSGADLLAYGLEVWWRLGWGPVVGAPLAWYGMILWYAGFWAAPASALRRRHRVWLTFTALLAGALLVSLITAHALPSFASLAFLDLSTGLSLGGVPALFVVYPVYSFLCIGLSVAALGRPAPTDRLMGGLARQRTRPWLLAAAFSLLAVSLAAGGFMLWAASSVGAASVRTQGLAAATAWFDLFIELLIAAAVWFIGQAITSYEVFTGRSLPRGGLRRHWRDAAILSAGLAGLVGAALALAVRPVYSLLVVTLIMVTFYALFSWRSFRHRDQFFEQLRPFVASQQLADQIAGGTGEAPSRAGQVFAALCEQVLDAQQAALVPLGRLAGLAGPPLVYPPGAPMPPALPIDVPHPGDRIAALDPAASGGFTWTIPLWSERGRIGALLLGVRRDGGLYTQEEIDIAQAAGERIVDSLAGEEMARRLMALERRRLAETQVVDYRTRRTLHDDILPELHTVILDLSRQPEAKDSVVALSALHRRMSDLIRTGAQPLAFELDGDFIAGLRSAIDAEFTGAFESVEWQGDGEPSNLDPLSREVVFHAMREAVRNAARHGRGGDVTRALRLSINVCARDGLLITVCDDGVGFDAGSAREQGGLALHRTLLEIVGGYLSVGQAGEGGTQVTIGLRA